MNVLAAEETIQRQFAGPSGNLPAHQSQTGPRHVINRNTSSQQIRHCLFLQERSEVQHVFSAEAQRLVAQTCRDLLGPLSLGCAVVRHALRRCIAVREFGPSPISGTSILSCSRMVISSSLSRSAGVSHCKGDSACPLSTAAPLLELALHLYHQNPPPRPSSSLSLSNSLPTLAISRPLAHSPAAVPSC